MSGQADISALRAVTGAAGRALAVLSAAVTLFAALAACGEDVVEVVAEIPVRGVQGEPLFVPGQARAYVSDGMQLHELDTERGEILHSLDLPAGDRSLGDISRDGKLLVLYSDCGISVARIENYTVKSERAIDSCGIMNAVLARGKLYASGTNEARVYVNLVSGHPAQQTSFQVNEATGPVPIGRFVRSADELSVYTFSSGRGVLYEIDTATDQVVRAQPCASPGAWGSSGMLAISPLGTHAGVFSGEVHIASLEGSPYACRRLALPGEARPLGFAFSPWDTQLALVLARGAEAAPYAAGSAGFPEPGPAPQPPPRRLFVMDHGAGEALEDANLPFDASRLWLSPDSSRALAMGDMKLYLLDMLLLKRTD